MDAFTSALFRELAVLVMEDRSGMCAAENKRKVLIACQRAVERIEMEPDFVARPDAALFSEVREYIAPADWEQAERVIRHNLRRAGVHFSRRSHLTLARG